jgi:hypothetical protein
LCTLGAKFTHREKIHFGNRNRCQDDRHALEQLFLKGSVRKAGDEFIVEADVEGASAKELSSAFLSALRKMEKRTTLRAEWSSDDRTSEGFFRLCPEEDNQQNLRSRKGGDPTDCGEPRAARMS